jgi:putative ABC transport system permease protein
MIATAFWRDLRLAARRLVSRPLPVLIAMLSLGFAIGANTLVFSVLNTLALRPVAGLAEPSRLVEIGRDFGNGALDTVGYRDVVALDTQVKSLSGAFGFTIEPVNFAASDEPRRALAMLVTENYFSVMGAQASAGQLFAPRESAPGANASVVISHAAWLRWFGGDTRVIGRDVRINGSTFQLRGVLAPGFHGHIAVLAPDFFVPVSMVAAVRPRDKNILENGVWLLAGARLAPGAAQESAQAEVAAAMAALAPARDTDARPTQYRYTVQPLRGIPGATSTMLMIFATILFALTGLVLMVACVNVASVLIARGAARRGELAMHLVLGASRGQLVRQALLESVMIALGAGIFGLLLAGWARGLSSLISVPAPFPIMTDIALDWRVAGFAIALSLSTILVFGLVPSLRVARADGRGGTAGFGSGAVQRTRGRELLVSVQFALSLTLLIAAGLFARALDRASAIETGFRTDGVLAADVDIGSMGLDATTTTARYDAIVEAVRALPGVEEAAFVRVPPLTLSNMSFGGVLPDGGGEALFWPNANIVTPGYFATLAMSVRGRDFNAADRAGGERVAIINDSFAQTIAPGGDALGRIFRFGEEGPGEAVRVIGIVPDGKNSSLADGHEPFVFFPQAQVDAGSMTLMTTTTLPVAEFARRLKTIVAASAPQLAAPTVDTFAERAAIGLVPQRIAGAIASVLGIVGAALAALGLYGLMAFQVTQRTREIGVRLALGASAARISRDVLASAGRLIAWGAGAGLVLGIAVAFALSTLLFGVAAGDVIAFAAATALLAAVALVAAWLPARRAARVQPSVALRYE